MFKNTDHSTYYPGRHFIVTGAAQGIGKAITLALVSLGARVTAADSDEEAGRELRDELANATDGDKAGNVRFIQTDVADEQEVQHCVAEAIEWSRRLDGVVSNAGIGIGKPVETLTLEEWNRVIGTNLTGAFLMAKHTASHLRQQNGAIVQIASTRALQSEADTEAYSASKGGIVALTHALAVSLGPEIRVNAISPGWIDVLPWKKTAERKTVDYGDEHHAQHPCGRIGLPEDIAQMVLFLLCGESAGFVTGQNFVVDGGMTRKMIYL